MSFQYVPTLLRTPSIPNWSIQRGIWRGVGMDNGLLAFNCGNYNLGNYVITQNLWAYQLKIDSSVYSPVFNDVNGYIYWQYNSYYLYYSRSFGWILHSRFPGYEPKENYNSETRQYDGDAFHAGSIPTAADGATSYLQPRGTNRNGGGANKTISFQFPRWQSVNRTQFGEYEAKGGLSGKKYIGLPRWRDNSYNYYVRSLEKKNGSFSYSNISLTNGKWVIGEVNSPAGWYEGEEPSKTAPVTFRFCKPEGSTISGYNRTLNLADYVQGSETTSAYMGEVAIWR